MEVKSSKATPTIILQESDFYQAVDVWFVKVHFVWFLPVKGWALNDFCSSRHWGCVVSRLSLLR